MAAKRPVKRPASAAELAKRFGVSPRTVRRVMAQPRDQYLAENSISREKPWLRLGISRATWYRLGKPDPDRASGLAVGEFIKNATAADERPREKRMAIHR